MARQTESGLQGKVGNTVFYEMYGNKYVRAAPGKRKKKRNSPPNEITSVFGAVSRYGTKMVSALQQYLLFPFSLFTYNQQRAWMRNLYAAHKNESSWELKAKNNLTSQVNLDSDLRDIWENGVTVVDEGGGIVTVTVPSIDPNLDMNLPANTRNITAKIFVVSSAFRMVPWPYILVKDQYSFETSKGVVQSREFRFNTAGNTGSCTSANIAIVVVAFEFETEMDGIVSINKDARWLPAAIVAMGRLK